MSSPEDYLSRKREWLEEDISFTLLNCDGSPVLLHSSSANYFQYMCIRHFEMHWSP